MNQFRKSAYIVLFLVCSASSYVFLMSKSSHSQSASISLQEQMEQNSVKKFENEGSKTLTFPVIEVVKKVIQLIRLLPLN